MTYTPRYKRILTAVCEAACVAPAEVCSYSRDRHVTRTRWCYWLLLREQGLTLTRCSHAVKHSGANNVVRDGLTRIAALAPGTLYEEVLAAGRSACKSTQLTQGAT